jgi:hypothetical protein
VFAATAELYDKMIDGLVSVAPQHVGLVHLYVPFGAFVRTFWGDVPGFEPLRAWTENELTPISVSRLIIEPSSLTVQEFEALLLVKVMGVVPVAFLVIAVPLAHTSAF